jgi:hypothetical protein
MGLPKDERVLMYDMHKDFSRANVPEVLPSAPMIGEIFLDLLRTATTPDLWHWRAAARLVLAVADQALNTDGPSDRLIRTARREVHNVTHLALRTHLNDVLDVTLGTCREHWRETVAQRLIAYAGFVRSVGHFAGAGEIYGMVAETVDLPASVRIEAYQGRAWVFRQLGQHADADLIYVQMRTLAESVGNTPMVLMAELGMARVMIERGGLPEAERMVRAVIARAETLGFLGVVSRAYIDLACVAGKRKRHDEVIVHTDTAMAGPLPPIDRDLCGVNMAYAYRNIRRFACAASYARIVVTTAEGLEERLRAGLILYHLTMDQGLDATAPRAFVDREGERMSAQLRAELYEAMARDAYLSDDLLTARHELTNGLAFSEAHHLNEMIVELDASLQSIERGTMPARFVAPNCTVPAHSVSSLRRIEYNARKAETESDNLRRLRADPAAASDVPRLLVETFVSRVVAAGS